MKLPANLQGDGRRLVAPSFTTPVPQHARCLKCTLSQARELVRSFTNGGTSTHARNASLLWVPIEWCEKNNFKYRVLTHEVDGEIAGYTCELLGGDDHGMEAEDV